MAPFPLKLEASLLKALAEQVPLLLNVYMYAHFTYAEELINIYIHTHI